MVQFAHPYAFFLLAGVALAARQMLSRRVRRGVLFSTAARVPSGRSIRPMIALAASILFLAGLTLAVIALARPRTLLSQTTRKADVIAIEMVVDMSGSMEALDMSDIIAGRIITRRTRLDAVKSAFADFIARRPDDLAGLVTFGGYASTRCPLTVDHDALAHILKGVEIPKPYQDRDGQVVNQEELLTAIGDALATACARLEKAEPKSKIIVLLSDGESNTGIIKPEDATALAKKMGIKVYTIGVGSTGTAPFPTRDMFGNEAIAMAEVQLDEALLRRIAAETGGIYFNVRDNKGLDNALKEINQLETTAIAREVYQQYDEWFAWLLGPAVLLIALGSGLNMLAARRLV
jgi:Ca-activated chloride channel family protein